MISAKYARTGEILQVKLTWKRRLALAIDGRAHIEDRGPPEFLASTPHYLALCGRHGYYIDYPHGNAEVLRCPGCFLDEAPA